MGLTLCHTRSFIQRAAPESFSRAVKRLLHHMEVRGVPVRRLVAAGGRAHSDVWRQNVSNIIQMPQHHLRYGEAARVAAFLGGYGLDSVCNLD